jgi:hypothetical protein
LSDVVEVSEDTLDDHLALQAVGCHDSIYLVDEVLYRAIRQLTAEPQQLGWSHQPDPGNGSPAVGLSMLNILHGVPILLAMQCYTYITIVTV